MEQSFGDYFMTPFHTEILTGSALVSLTYNAGARGSRGTYKLIEKGDFKGAAANIRQMTRTTIKGKKVVARGLISRRAEESAPFAPIEAPKKK